LSILHETAELLLLAIVLFVLAPAIRQHCGKANSLLIKVGFGVVFALTSIFFAGWMILHALYQYGTYGRSYRAAGVLEVAFYVFYLLAIIIVGVVTLLTVKNHRSDPNKKVCKSLVMAEERLH
jgi:hypothetical protein